MNLWSKKKKKKTFCRVYEKTAVDVSTSICSGIWSVSWSWTSSQTFLARFGVREPSLGSRDSTIFFPDAQSGRDPVLIPEQWCSVVPQPHTKSKSRVFSSLQSPKSSLQSVGRTSMKFGPVQFASISLRHITVHDVCQDVLNVHHADNIDNKSAEKNAFGCICFACTGRLLFSLESRKQQVILKFSILAESEMQNRKVVKRITLKLRRIYSWNNRRILYPHLFLC